MANAKQEGASGPLYAKRLALPGLWYGMVVNVGVYEIPAALEAKVIASDIWEVVDGPQDAPEVADEIPEPPFAEPVAVKDEDRLTRDALLNMSEAALAEIIEEHGGSVDGRWGEKRLRREAEAIVFTDL